MDGVGEDLLPGYPLLEARLKATTAGIAPFVEGMEPESHFVTCLQPPKRRQRMKR